MIYHRRAGPKSQILFHGVRLVRLHESCTREAIRFFREGNLLAIIQKNGNVAISATGIFEDEKNVFAQLKAATCLRGLKLVSEELLEAHKRNADDAQKESDKRYLRMEADRLGFSLKPRGRK